MWVARGFAALFPQAELTLVENGRHYVQVDEPEAVADAVLGAGLPKHA